VIGYLRRSFWGFGPQPLCSAVVLEAGAKSAIHEILPALCVLVAVPVIGATESSALHSLRGDLTTDITRVERKIDARARQSQDQSAGEGTLRSKS
jgi:hypothetical protein